MFRTNCKIIFFNWYSRGGRWSPIGATSRPIVPAPDDYDDGEIGGMIGRRNRRTRRKPAPVPLCPPQTPHASWTRARDAAVGSQGLTPLELRHGPNRTNCKKIL
jgi:hypothetical protein